MWLRADLVGIVVMRLGDFVSGVYMVFWCEGAWRVHSLLCGNDN